MTGVTRSKDRGHAVNGAMGDSVGAGRRLLVTLTRGSWLIR